MAPFSLSTNRRFCYVRTRYSFHCSHLVFRLAFSLTWSVVVPALMGEKPFSLEYNTIDEARKWQKYLRKVKQIRFRLDRVLRAEGLCFGVNAITQDKKVCYRDFGREDDVQTHKRYFGLSQLQNKGLYARYQVWIYRRYPGVPGPPFRGQIWKHFMRKSP